METKEQKLQKKIEKLQKENAALKAQLKRRDEKLEKIGDSMKENKQLKKENESMRTTNRQTKANELSREDEIRNEVIAQFVKDREMNQYSTSQKEAFERGDRYICDEHTEDNAMFDPETLLLNINPRTGRRLSLLDKQILLSVFGGCKAFQSFRYPDVGGLADWYWAAKQELYEFNQTNHTDEEVVEWTYEKGMQILKNYVEII